MMKKRLFLRNLFVLTLALLIPVFLAVSISLNYYEDALRKREINAAETELTLLNYATDNLLYMCGGIASQIKNDSQLLNWLSQLNTKQASYSSFYPMFKTWTTYTEPLINCGNAESVYLYLDGMDVVLSTDGLRYFSTFRDTSWLEIYQTSRQRLSVMGFFTCARPGADGSMVISCFTPLIDVQGELRGVLVINIAPPFFHSFSSRSSYESAAFYLLNENNEQFYSDNGSAISELFEEEYIFALANGGTIELTAKNGEKYIVIAQKSIQFDWCFFQIVKEMDIFAVLGRLRSIFSYILAASFLVTIAFSLFYTVQNYRPVSTMVSIIDTYNENGVVSDPSKQHSDIYDHIIYGLINALVEKNNMRIKVAKLELAEKEAQLQAIQSRINPHFLYNSLDVVNWMIIRRLGPTNDISPVLKAMADNFRSILSDGRLIVTVEEEIGFLNRYFDFLRYVDYRNLKTVCQVDDRIKQVSMPRLLLQPLVENCYVHGLEKSTSPIIHVIAKLKEGNVQIFITDNGEGIPEGRLAELDEALRLGAKKIGSGASGMCNVNSRLILRYGPAYRLHVFSKEGHGTAIRVLIPLSFVDPIHKTYIDPINLDH